VDPPRPSKKETNTIASESIPVLLNEARRQERAGELPYYALLLTALHTGMRRGELLAIRWCDVDLDLATISVSRSLQYLKDGTLVIREPKTPKARRSIAMTPTLVVELRDHKATQQAARLFVEMPMSNDDLAFSHVDGTPIHPDGLTKAFSKIARRVGLSLRLHDLRHSHATLMLKSGIHPKIVSERLGHATVAFTLDTYSHVVPGLQEAAALAFDKSLKESAPTNVVEQPI